MTSVQPGHVAQALSLVGLLCPPESAVRGKAEPPSHCRIVGSLEQPGHFRGSVQDPRALRTAPGVLGQKSFLSGIFYEFLKYSSCSILVFYFGDSKLLC